MTVAIGASAINVALGNPIATSGITTTASGSNFYIVAMANNGGVSSIVDSKSNSYTQIASKQDTNNGRWIYLYECLNGTGGSSHTATLNAGDNGFAIALVEVTGSDTTDPSETPTTDYNTGDATMNCSVTTGADNELVLTAGFVTSAGNAIVLNGGFTGIDSGTSAYVGGATAYKSVASASTAADPAWTQNGGGAFEGLSITVALKDGAPPGPAITDAGDENYTPGETGITITGTAFGASQGAGKVWLSPTNDVNDALRVQQTVTAWADTSITITTAQGNCRYGATLYLFVVDNAAAASNGHAVTLSPVTGKSYVNLASVHSPSSERLTSSPDLEIGDQIEVSTIQGTGTVTVADDATWQADIGVTSFNFRVWDNTDGTWGAAATQTIQGVSIGWRGNRMSLGLRLSLA